MQGSEPATTADTEAAAADAVGSHPARAEGLRLFLDLGVAQLDAALRESDAQCERMAEALGRLAADLRGAERAGGTLDAVALAALAGQVQDVLRTLQFYSKLTQRLGHVRDGLAIPADAMAGGAEQSDTDWQGILNQVRARYSLVEERVLFDFMMRGLSATEMLKALRSLRDAAAAGEHQAV